MRRGVRGRRLKHVKAMRPRPGGKVYLYFAKPGHQLVRLPDLPEDHPDFLKAYAAAAEGAPRARSVREPRSGTVAALVVSYRRSDAFRDLRASTREVRRRILDKIAAKGEAALVRDLLPRHIRADLGGLTADAANNRLKVWRALTRHAVDREWIATDPARDVRRRTVETDGHHCWTDDEIAQYRERHASGSKARLAMELALWTGARRADLVRLGRQMLAKGSLTYTAEKNRVTACIPLLPEFRAELDQMPAGQMLFLETAQGKPHSVKALGAWFRLRCREAGLPDRCTLHGLRKARARMMAEQGKTAHQIMAWGAWKTLAEVAHYTAASDRRRLTHEGVTGDIDGRDAFRDPASTENSR